MRRPSWLLFGLLLAALSIVPFLLHPGQLPHAGLGGPAVAFVLPLSEAASVDGAVVALTSLRRHSGCVQAGGCPVLCVAVQLPPPAAPQLAGLCRVLRAAAPPPPPADAGWRPGLGPRQWAVLRTAGKSLRPYGRLIVLSDAVLFLRSPDVLATHPNPLPWSGAHAAASGGLWLVHPAHLESSQPPPSLNLTSRSATTLLNTSLAYDVPVAIDAELPPPETISIRFLQAPWAALLNSMVPELGAVFWLWWRCLAEQHRASGENFTAPAGTPVLAQHRSAVAPPPTPPSWRTHLWVGRGTPAQFLLWLTPPEERDRWLPGLLPLPARPGESCELFCYKRSNVCSERGLFFRRLNSCAALRAAFNCSRCVWRRDAKWAPGHDTGSGVCYAHALLGDAVALPNCTAAARHVTRLCPCIPLDQYYGPAVPFRAVDATREMATEVPATAANLRAARLAHPSGCYPTITNFTAEDDERCGKYLSNVSNMLSVRVMAAPFLFARTVKFHVTYREPGICAVLKVSQDGFLFEPHSEWLAWRVDRLLDIWRVPPTAWADVPMAMLVEVIAAANDTALSTWTAMAFVRHSRRLHRARWDPQTGVEVVGCSVQLWMADVHQLDLSVAALPYKRWTAWLTPGKYAPQNAHQAAVLPGLAEQAVYDFILGNDDRRTNKNCYVAGGCRYQCRRPTDEPAHLGPPFLLSIDQGKAFYPREDPPNPLSEPNSTFCTFPRRLYAKGMELSSNTSNGRVSSQAPAGKRTTLFHRLRDTSPLPIYRLVGDTQVKYCQRRLETWLGHVRQCVVRYGEKRVLRW